MILQNVVFPKIGICTEEELYFKKLREDSSYDYENAMLNIVPGDIIKFDSYFNAFLADRWKKYTDLSNCFLKLKGSGKGKLKIYRYSSYNGMELLKSHDVDLEMSGTDIPIFSSTEEIYGIVFFEYEAKTPSSIVSGEFYSDDNPVNDISLGIVITTFKREKYVKRNMNSLNRHLFSKINDKKMHIYLIDNGQTLPPSESERITIIPNKNYGGAGGFGKGMLELYLGKKYNHVVFCDDDAVYEPEAFLRLYNFLSMAKNPELCVGGSMLKLDDPKYIYESGAKYINLEGSPNKNMLDMSKFSSLINFSYEEYATYHAWWFFAAPISCVMKLGLPLPIFFQMDDVEYSLRLREHGYTTAELNGICVWHESFQRKSSTATNYYWVRNELIVSSLHGKDLSVFAYIRWFTKYFVQSLFVYRYDRARMMLKGATDALKGPEFLIHLNPSVYHQKLLKQQVDKPHNIDKNQIILSKYNRPVRNDKLKKLVMMITLNGMLLPGFLRNKGKDVMDKGYVIEPLQGFRAAANFRKERILYVDVERMSGFIVDRSPKQFWQLLLNLVKMDISLLLHFNKKRKLYRDAYKNMTSIEFWKKYVG